MVVNKSDEISIVTGVTVFWKGGRRRGEKAKVKGGCEGISVLTLLASVRSNPPATLVFRDGTGRDWTGRLSQPATCTCDAV